MKGDVSLVISAGTEPRDYSIYKEITKISEADKAFAMIAVYGNMDSCSPLRLSNLIAKSKRQRN